MHLETVVAEFVSPTRFGATRNSEFTHKFEEVSLC